MSVSDSIRTAVPTFAKARPTDILELVAVRLRTWRKLARDRAELASLGDRGLLDIAADKATVELEVRRAFWQKPIG